ncbi:protein OS-9-like isoform X3 [Stegodyphus dumicola]|uniref:protein OS-9-like isoform X3 n=1 Tax=Stegodyphus dumicola TaxID=202533 RepID=UPI0015AB7DE2|nr:protein OS-9-like isoform X3 [Stegodyphus dumicola]
MLSCISKIKTYANESVLRNVHNSFLDYEMLRVLNMYSVLAVILLSVIHCVFTFNVEELKWINYEVDILKTPVKRGDEQSLPVMYMTSMYGQEYQCILPEVTEDEVTEKETDSEKSTDIQELLKPMKTGSCLLKGKDWWTYEFCFGHYIKQFHIEDGQIIGQVLTLGLYESDYDWDNETDQVEKFKHAKQRYHTQYYVNGTKCDLTGQPRNAEVRIYCEEDAGDYIYRVDEPGTCSYVITVHTSRLCSHPKLKPLPSNKAHTIPCHPVLNKEQYSSYIIKLNEEKAIAEQKRNQWLNSQQERLQVLKNGNSQDLEGEEIAKLREFNRILNQELNPKPKGTDSGSVKVDSPLSEDKDKISRVSSDSEKKTNAKLLKEGSEKLIQNFLLQDYDKDDDSKTSDSEIKVKTVEIDKGTLKVIEDEQTQSAVLDDDKLHVRIRRLDRKSPDSSGKLYEMDFVQRKKLEQAVKEKLEKAGLDTGGRRIEVKIITAGYYDNEDGKDFHSLSDEETNQFQNMIMALLTGQQEAVQEMERHKKLEENYKFIWKDEKKDD